MSYSNVIYIKSLLNIFLSYILRWCTQFKLS